MNVFVDTSAFVALENRRDAHHQEAVREYRRLIRAGTFLVTSDYVFDETVTLLKVRAGTEIAARWGERLLASALFDLIVIGRETIERALTLFAGTGDQAFGFTDCASFSIMRARGIPVAFAFDEDFRRFGFDQVPRRR